MEGLKELFGSKKVRMALATILSVASVVYFKVDVPVEILASLIALVGALILGQGLADRDKVAAAINAEVELERIAASERVEELKADLVEADRLGLRKVDPTPPSP